MRLKPHEAQSYRKKALWVSWVSIAVTIILAIVAFSEWRSSHRTLSFPTFRRVHPQTRHGQTMARGP